MRWQPLDGSLFLLHGLRRRLLFRYGSELSQRAPERECDHDQRNDDSGEYPAVKTIAFTSFCGKLLCHGKHFIQYYREKGQTFLLHAVMPGFVDMRTFFGLT